MLLEIVEHRERISRTFGGKRGPRLAERIDGIGAHRQRQNVVVMLLGLAEAADPGALLSQRGTIGDGVGAGQPVAQFAVALLRVKPVGDALARLPRAGAREPFGNELDRDIGERAHHRHQQDNESPGPQSPCSRGVIDQRDIEEQNDQSDGHVTSRSTTTAQAS